MTTPKYDFLIVGQGLAGTLVSWILRKHYRQEVMHVDRGHDTASSKAAAGLINPITGRRYVKSWRFDDLLPVALSTYAELESELGIELVNQRNIIRSLFNRREENDWLARTGEPAYQQYMLDEPDLENYRDYIRPAFRYGEVQHSAQVHIGRLIAAFREKLLVENRILEETFDYAALSVAPTGVRYRSLTAKAIIFAEGAQAAANPFFADLPFGGAKGQAIWVRIPDVHFSKILKQRIFIVPWQNDIYWIGSTNANRFPHDQPTEEARTFLQERLEDILTVPFKLMDHRSAIKPTVRDRRPFLGVHPRHKNIFIFNGLGTKGTSLGPYWAKHLCAFILKNGILDKEVDISRFARSTSN